MFQAIKTAPNESAPAIIEELRKLNAWSDSESNALVTIGYMEELQESGSVPSSINGLLRLLNNAHKQRLLAGMGYELINTLGASLVHEEIIQESENKVTHFVSTLADASDLCLSEASDFISEILDDKLGQSVKTGIKPLDDKMGGFYKQDVILLAGRPSSGKTAFALSLARNVANQGPVVMFSLEMSKGQIAQRLTSMESGVPLSRIRNRSWMDNEHEFCAVRQVCDAISRLPIMLSDVPCSISEIQTQLNKIFHKSPPALVIIDYIQLIIPDDKRAPREQQISQFSRSIKNMAKAFNTPFLVLSQLNRTATSERPQLHHLRESGALEQDADVVLAINHGPIDTDILILKHRNGPIGEIPIYWEPTLTLFRAEK